MLSPFRYMKEVMEQWDEKITDCIDYLILLKALVKEEQAYGSH